MKKELRNETIMQLYNEGKSVRYIGKQINSSKSNVHRIIQAYLNNSYIAPCKEDIKQAETITITITININ